MRKNLQIKPYWLQLMQSFFFSIGLHQYHVFVPPMPRDSQDLRENVTTAFATIDRDILKRVKEKYDFRLDICFITKGSHIEYLWNKTCNISYSSKVNFILVLIIYAYFFKSSKPGRNYDTPCIYIHLILV